jgi:dihydrofolate reductase
MISAFNFITLDGYYKGLDEDIGWHKHGGEEARFSEEKLQPGNTLLFGRVTYQMMSSFWPTQMAKESFPVVAEGMNKAEKIVFSRTLQKTDWQNSRIIGNDIIAEMTKLKRSAGKNFTILGSGTIVTQFAEAGLIDLYQVMIDPVAIGNGTSLFKGLKKQLDLELLNTRTFSSGVILLEYKPKQAVS